MGHLPLAQAPVPPDGRNGTVTPSPAFWLLSFASWNRYTSRTRQTHSPRAILLPHLLVVEDLVASGREATPKGAPDPASPAPVAQGLL